MASGFFVFIETHRNELYLYWQYITLKTYDYPYEFKNCFSYEAVHSESFRNNF
jgi:hypothetical protein